MNKFKRGDRVKIIKVGSKWNNFVGTIEDVLNDRMACIKFDVNSRIGYFGTQYVKHLNAEPKADNKGLWDELGDDFDE